MIKQTNETTEIPTNHRSHSAPNQSTSCPLSSVICSVASHSASKPNPIASNRPRLAARMYGGSSTKSEIRNTPERPPED